MNTARRYQTCGLSLFYSVDFVNVSNAKLAPCLKIALCLKMINVLSQQLLNFSLTLVEKRVIYLCHRMDKNMSDGEVF